LRTWRDNGLAVVLTVLFLLCLAGHAVSGWKDDNKHRQQQGQPPVTLGTFIASSEFAETVFENWESEFFQMGFYVLLTVFLYQKGSSESKKHDGTDEVDEDPEEHRDDPEAPGPVRAGGWQLALYKNSLALAYLVLFLASFIGHAAGGAQKYNNEQRESGSSEQVTTLQYMQTAHFWYESFQNWQSEFLAVLSIVVLSIRLRQWGSPESKPVHAPHSSTGSG
jgi:hypothetical protein